MNQATQNRQAGKMPTFFRGGTGGGRLGRERGSLLILCVTVLIIIALIGIAFLQRVRLDQFATARHERNYMDLVINGVLGDIGTQLEKDVFENWSDGDPLYDYPWTEDVQRILVTPEYLAGPVAVNGAGPPAPGLPTHEDDRWLASTAPVWHPTGIPGGEYRWLHLTNLTGIWLDLPVVGNTVGAFPGRPAERLINGIYGHPDNSDTDLKLTGTAGLSLAEPFNLNFQRRGVDADLDGVLDSRWQWAPAGVRNIGGRKYIMAVRIIDLNSMLNINTAAMPAPPRGWTPSDVDLSQMLRRIKPIKPGLAPTAWRSELRAVLNFRAGATTIGTVPALPTLGQTDLLTLWEDQAAIYGNSDRNYLSSNEIELRRLGGINDTSIQSDLENVMPKLLRQTNPNGSVVVSPFETSYIDVVDPLNALSSDAQISEWFYGKDPGSFNDDNTNRLRVANREFPGVRHMLTTASGVGAYVTKFGAGGLLKTDLKQQWDDFAAIRGSIDDVFGIAGTSGEPYLRPATNGFSLVELIDEYALAIQDYSDADSVPTERTVGGVTYYGLERLPFLREAYFQILYQDNDLVALPPNEFDTWVALDGTQGVVIELGNPFSHDLLGTGPNGLNRLIRIVIEQSGVQVIDWVYDNANIPNFQARDDALDTDTLIVVSDPTDNTTNGEGLGIDQETDLNLISAPNLVTTLGTGDLTFDADGSNITVLLQVDVTGAGGWVTYDRMTTNVSFAPTIAHAASTIDPTMPAPAQHAQASFQRNSQAINYVSVASGNGVANALPEDPPASFGSYSPTIHEFGNDTKTGVAVGTPLPATFQLSIADDPMRSVAELAWVHMFGFTNRPNESFSERIGTIPLNQHFLLLDPADLDYDVTVQTGLPHAALLMDAFTTLSPEKDGRDNDNDDGDNDPLTAATAILPDLPSIDNDTEQFIPGTINVNTAPLHILTLGAPMTVGAPPAAESLDDIEQLMRTLIAYRDEPLRGNLRFADTHGDYWGGGSGAPLMGFDVREARDLGPDPVTDPPFSGVRLSQPGIASIGELMFLNPLPTTGPVPAHDMMRYGFDGPAVVPATLDLYPNPETSGISKINLGDDNEQLLARFQMLSQAFTVRSDRFAVYAVVRGYKEDGFNRNPVETAKFIAVFDRSAMTGAGDTPRVIGFVRLQ